MSEISDSARKAKATKAKNLRNAEEERKKTFSVEKRLAKAQSELKAYKDLINAGWSPPNK